MKILNIVQNFMGEQALNQLDEHTGSVTFPWYFQREDQPYEDRCDMFHKVYSNDTWVTDGYTKDMLSYPINMINPVAFLDIRLQNYVVPVNSPTMFHAYNQGLLHGNDTVSVALLMLDNCRGSLIVDAKEQLNTPIESNTLVLFKATTQFRFKLDVAQKFCRVVKIVFVQGSD